MASTVQAENLLAGRLSPSGRSLSLQITPPYPEIELIWWMVLPTAEICRLRSKLNSPIILYHNLNLSRTIYRPRRGHKEDMLTTEQLVHYLRSALDHLYDPDKLRRSPLAALLGIADRVDTPLVLRRILTDAIESLRPEADVPYHSPVWRVYEVLLYRYVQQFSQQEVADQLGLSVRHLRREQEAALEMLATHLWTHFELGARLEAEASTGEISPPASWGLSPTVNEELAWLRDPSLSEPANVAQVLSTVLDLAKPLAAQYGVHLEITLPDTLPDLAVQSIALRQALLSLLTVAMHRASGGQILISAEPALWAVEVQVLATSPRPGPRPILNDDMASLDMARRLVNICGGKLTLPASEETFTASLTLPALEQLPVLAIDDNKDTLRLLKRYTSSTRYRLVGTRDPEEALSLAEKISPRIIILDVMMPEVDGWELLGRLRQHPLTGRIPIVVCTVLAQKELGLSLGASDFLRKPIARQTFLEALDRQVLKTVTGSR